MVTSQEKCTHSISDGRSYNIHLFSDTVCAVNFGHRIYHRQELIIQEDETCYFLSVFQQYRNKIAAIVREPKISLAPRKGLIQALEIPFVPRIQFSTPRKESTYILETNSPVSCVWSPAWTEIGGQYINLPNLAPTHLPTEFTNATARPQSVVHGQTRTRGDRVQKRSIHQWGSLSDRTSRCKLEKPRHHQKSASGSTPPSQP